MDPVQKIHFTHKICKNKEKTGKIAKWKTDNIMNIEMLYF